MMTVKQEYLLLKAEYRLFGDGDPWGQAMHWHFTVADELYWREGWTPEHWQYQPSPLGPCNDQDDHATVLVVEAGADALMAFGNLLDRYCRLLRHLGKNY